MSSFLYPLKSPIIFRYVLSMNTKTTAHMFNFRRSSKTAYPTLIVLGWGFFASCVEMIDCLMGQIFNEYSGREPSNNKHNV